MADMWNNWEILATHCNCMAGLGEACSHVAAVMFYVECAVRIHSSKTVTDEKAYWMLPPALENVPYCPISDMDFKSPSTKKKELDQKIESIGKEDSLVKDLPVAHKKAKVIPRPSDTEIDSFFDKLSKNKYKPAILSIIPMYLEWYRPLPLTQDFPQVLSGLTDSETFHLNFSDLLKHCETVYSQLSITKEQSEAVEQETQKQSDSRSWFQFKPGRISGSIMQSCCHTDPDLPSQALIKWICYPKSFWFSARATQCGCDHEKHTLKSYKDIMSKTHINFILKESWFVISTDHPFVGVSPDGIAKCDCCGEGCVEMKCPFCINDTVIEEGINKRGFCLTKNDLGQT